MIEEAKLAAKLSHGSIVQVIDLGREGDTMYIAMEYVEGFDLSELLRRCSQSKVPLPVEFSLMIVQEVLRALDYAHKKKGQDGRPLGIVHRNVSPSNVIVSFDGQVKLCDFGIARAMGVSSDDLPKEAIQGKAGYMSPEAARGEPVDARSDVFAAGVIFWELLAGRRLYKGQSGRSPSLEQARDAVIPELPKRDLPSEDALVGIIMRALAKQPTERFQSARDMLKVIEEYVADSGLLASPMRFGEWLTEHFAKEILEQRRLRELAAQALSEFGDATPAAAKAPAPAPAASYPHVEVPPPSLMAVVQSTRQPTPSAAEPEDQKKTTLIYVAIAVVVAIVLAVRYLMR